MMEYRHYITLGIAILVMQLFLYVFARTLGWLFSLMPRTRKRLTVAFYLFANSALVLHALQIVPMFRPVAWALVLLLFCFFVSSGAWLLYQFGKRLFNPQKVSNTLRLAYPFAFFGLIGLGLYNAYTPNVVHYSMTIDKPLKPLRIGVASDFHLGKLFGGRQLEQLAQIFDEQKVDLILLPGDIMDDDLTAYHAEQMQPQLAKLRAPLGVYATLGNHDFFGVQKQIADEIRNVGIQVLWDQRVTFDQNFTIIGRNDDLNKKRPTAAKLLENLDPTLPIFLMDHRPTDILKHSELPIDLQVSGHTHKGQIFPANIITKLIYRLDYGHEKIGNTHFVVTSGYGFWGVPMRLGSQSEVVIIDIKGK